MKHIVLVALAMMGFTAVANALSLEKYEIIFQPLGLERAVKVNGMDCLMTTEYDTHARCGTERVNLKRCEFPAFEDGDLVCHLAPPWPPTAPTHNIRR